MTYGYIEDNVVGHVKFKYNVLSSRFQSKKYSQQGREMKRFSWDRRRKQPSAKHCKFELSTCCPTCRLKTKRSGCEARHWAT